MIDFINAGRLDVACPSAGTSVAAAARVGVAAVSGVRGGLAPAYAVRERATAPATVAVVANERPAAHHGFAVVGAVAAADAQLSGHQKSQLHSMWALRGLDPWTDPT